MPRLELFNLKKLSSIKTLLKRDPGGGGGGGHVHRGRFNSSDRRKKLNCRRQWQLLPPPALPALLTLPCHNPRVVRANKSSKLWKDERSRDRERESVRERRGECQVEYEQWQSSPLASWLIRILCEKSKNFVLQAQQKKGTQ